MNGILKASCADERIDDLQYKGMRLIQRRSGFRFGTDSVLLAS
ncbi:MAG: SAM-dependent methyltransferase, partial [Clostridiales bacterium]|nr:SAM-dependent methyltransferase [Clostridiales bacterium]